MHKKSIAGYKPEHNQCCSSSSTSESGSGGSHPLKIKKPHTKVEEKRDGQCTVRVTYNESL